VAERDEAQDFKRRARRRLIGAVALVLFLVIVPPWIMEREPKPTVSGLSVEIPSQDAKRGAPRPAPAAKSDESKTARPADKVANADDRPEVRAAPAVPAEPGAGEEAKPRAPMPEKVDKPAEKSERAEKPRPAEPAPKPSPKESPSRDTSRKAEAERAEALLAGGTAPSYVVPVGTYTTAEGVRKVQARLSGAGVKSYTEAAGNGQTRVRAGPFASRDSAEKAREKMASLGLKPGAVVARKAGG
jgi:DedD protein